MGVGALIEKFRGVALERVERVGLCALAIESRKLAPGQADQLMREIHTLKGEAKMMGFADVNLVAHQVEGLLIEAGERDWSPSAPIASTLLEGVDLIRALLTKTAGGATEPIDLSRFVDRIAAARAELERGEAPGSARTTARVRRGADLALGAPDSVRVRLDELARLGRESAELALVGRRLDYQIGTIAEARRRLAAWRERAAPALPKARAASLRSIERALDAAIGSIAAEGGAARARAARVDDEVRALRYVRLAEVLSHYPRAVRDLAAEQDKSARLEVDLGQVALERGVIAALSEPIVHAVRNAVDHGVETPAEREAAGKPPEALVRLEAALIGDAVRVSITDDGRGVDLGALRRAAQERGLSSEASEVDDAAALRLVFAPGLTTREEVTDVSGRGIGMDVVRDRIAALGGSVAIESEPGRGTKLTMRVPLDASILPILLVQIGPQRYAVQADAVDRIERLELAPSGEARLASGERIPLANWSERLGAPPAATIERGDLLVVRGEAGLRGYAVSEVLGEREAAYRPLGAFLAGMHSYRGVVVTEGGEALVLLDLRGVRRPARPHHKGGAHRRVLVVEDSEVTRDLVGGALRRAGFEVLEASDGLEAIAVLESKAALALVVTDLEMPEMGGLAFLEALRASPTYDQTPAIVLSTRSDEATRRRAAELGAGAYLVKLDFRAGELIEAARRLTAARLIPRATT